MQGTERYVPETAVKRAQRTLGDAKPLDIRGVFPASTIAAMAEEATQAVPDRDDVWEALENVIDPELGLDFVSLGLVYDVELEGSDVHITFTLTSPGCPIGPQVTEQMKEFVSEVEGVEKVLPKMVFSPPWSPEKMSEDAKFALGY
jgi:metal-sulfur cluster biosynthetic enzyme